MLENKKKRNPNLRKCDGCASKINPRYMTSILGILLRVANTDVSLNEVLTPIFPGGWKVV